MGGRVAVNVKLELQSTLGSASAAVGDAGITQANPGVVTLAAHGYSDGDFLIATSIDGMTELDGQIIRVANSTTNTFELEGIDTTSFSAAVAASTTFKKITAWTTLSNATNCTMPDGAPTKLDATPLTEKYAKRYLFGLPDAPDGSIDSMYDPSVTAVAKVKAASIAHTTLGMRLTWADGKKTAVNAFFSGGQGFDANQNQVVKAKIAFTPVGQVLEFAS
jgi:hypothetical protein